MKVEIIKCLKDNFSYLLINEKNQNACVIDPSESGPIIDFVEKKNINLKFILNTHHHYDHVGGNNDLKKKYILNIVGFKNDKDRIPKIDILTKIQLINNNLAQEKLSIAKFYLDKENVNGSLIYLMDIFNNHSSTLSIEETLYTITKIYY